METAEPPSKHQELQSLSSLDNLASAMRTNIIPNQEYLLQGSVLDTSVDVLLHRLRGLSDNADNGVETFHDHEICYVLQNNPAQTGPPLMLRVRRPLDSPFSPWHLRYVGQSELGDKNRPTMIRNVLDMACGSDIIEFLKELGCRREFDHVAKGYVFRKGRIKILVSKLYRTEPGKGPQDLEPVSGSHYVEMSVVAPSGQDVIGEDMKNLADQLKPLITLDKVEQRRPT